MNINEPDEEHVTDMSDDLHQMGEWLAANWEDETPNQHN